MFENRPRLPTGRGGMFICSKLGENLSEMDVRTFVRIRRVIRNHLLAFKAEIIQKQALFHFPCWTTREEYLWARVNYAVCSVSFVLVSSSPRNFFRLNQVRKVRKRCSHSRFNFQAIILRNVGLCCWRFSVAMGDRGIFVESSNDHPRKPRGYYPGRCDIFGRKFTLSAEEPLGTYSYRTSSRSGRIPFRWLGRKIFFCPISEQL